MDGFIWSILCVFCRLMVSGESERDVARLLLMVMILLCSSVVFLFTAVHRVALSASVQPRLVAVLFLLMLSESILFLPGMGA